MHGRNPMTLDPRIPTMAGRSMSGFHRPGRQGGGGVGRVEGKMEERDGRR